jgi:hypothetical protein
MPDLTSSPAIDVALGLIFMFFLLSIICSTVNELIAATFRWRAGLLEQGVRSMLTGESKRPKGGEVALVKELAEHPLIYGKVSSVRKGFLPARPFPSYMNPKTFALTLLDTVAPPPKDAQVPSHDVLARAREYALKPDTPDSIQRPLLAFLDQAGNDVARFRKSVETWFELTMDRVSGWYKRRSQIALIVIALVVTLLANADAVQVGRALWNDDAVRSAVVAQAQQAVDKGQATPDVGKGASQAADTLSQQVSDVKSLGLPLGWSTDPKDPRWFDSGWGAAGKVFGLIATTLALTLGAPFWFDLLGRVSRLRTTGKPEREGAA